MMQQTVRVLIADDSEDDRLLLAYYLRRLPGFDLSGITTNGLETIAWLSGAPPYCNRDVYPFPDLLLLDNEMPGYSGTDIIEWLRDQPRRPAIVLWSDSPELIDRPKASQLGATLICEKPVCRSELNSILARLFHSLPIPSAPSGAVTAGTPEFRGTRIL